MKRHLAALVVSSIALTVGCSGDGGNAKVAFLARANQLCTVLRDDYTAGRLKLPTPSTASDIKDWVQGSYAPRAISTYQQISALPLPKEDADSLQALLTAAIAEVKLIQSDPATFGVPATQRDLMQRFQEAGLTECGAGFQRELDKPQFIIGSNGICSGLAAKVRSSMRSLAIETTSPVEAIVPFVHSTLAPLYRDAQSQIEALGFPAGDEALLTKLLQDWRADVDALDQDPSLFNAVRPAVRDISDRWTQYGAASCRAGGPGFQLGTDVPQPTIDKSQFIIAVNAICSSLAANVQATTRSSGIGNSSSPDAIAAFVHNTLAPLFRDSLLQVESVGFPPGDEELLTKLLQDWRADVEAVDQNPSLYNEVRPAVFDVSSRWVQYGATSCGVGG